MSIATRLLIVCITACLPVIVSCATLLLLMARGVLTGTSSLALLLALSALCTACGGWGALRLSRDLPSKSRSSSGSSAGRDSGRGALRRPDEGEAPCIEGQSAADAGSLPAPAFPAPYDLIAGPLLFGLFMAHLPAVAVLKDQAGRYRYVSAGCERLLKKTAAEMIGHTDAELFGGVITDPITPGERQVIEKRSVINSIEKMTLGAEQRFFAVTRFAVTPPGQPALAASICVDITDKMHAEEERAELERQLLQAQKMEAIGTLASGITHDFNNILSAIFGYVELARMDSQDNAKVQTQLEQVLRAAHRAKELVRQILAFSRKQEHDRKPLNLKPLVKEALKLLRASLPSTITIRLELNDEGAMVLADATQMHQVIMNLCTNAAQAMESNGGELTVRLSKLSVNASPHEEGVAPGTYLGLSVQDTGYGIDTVLRERIFEPYFTTKAPGKGTGMGLAVVHSIIKSHGGTIQVLSRPGEGSCFTVLVPVTESVVQMPHAKIVTLPRGTESVLFVDDEPFLADLGGQMLSRLGYRVDCSTSSMEALQIIRAHPERYDLLITDMTMPHITGEGLIQQVTAVRPDLPVILCTGYTRQIKGERAARLGIHAFLIKPLTIDDLAHAVRNVLDSASCPLSAAGAG